MFMIRKCFSERNWSTLLVAFCLIILSSLRVDAQSVLMKKPGIILGADIIYSMPKGNFNTTYEFGLGGELLGGVGFGSTYLTGSIGITGYNSRPEYPNNLTVIPIKAGLRKYLFFKKIFVNADLGQSTLKFNKTSSKAFTAGFGGGVRLLGFEVSLYYNTFKNNAGYTKSGFSNNVQLKAGWNFIL